MLIGKVVSNIWATRKDEKLKGLKLMVVELEGSSEENKVIVAADYIGAGEGDRVLIVTGSSARHVFEEGTPLDATIVGIIDTEESE